MGFYHDDRIRDTSTTTGTGVFTVSGTAPIGYQNFADYQVNDTLPYFIRHQTANEWEVGIATYSASNQLTRTKILSSSNADAAVNFSAGTKDVVVGFPSWLSLLSGEEDTIASAATTDIGTGTDSLRVAVSGTTTITSFGTLSYKVRLVRFTGALTLTHNATSLILPGGANITTAAGDTALFTSDASGNWRCYTYMRAAGRPLNTGTSDTIAVGFKVTPNSLGNITSFTVDPALGNYQYGTNHAAATWTAPASDCAVDILVTNDATAGAITFSGFTVGTTGDALTTTNGNKFIISIRRLNAISTYTIKALQ